MSHSREILLCIVWIVKDFRGSYYVCNRQPWSAGFQPALGTAGILPAKRSVEESRFVLGQRQIAQHLGIVLKGMLGFILLLQ